MRTSVLKALCGVVLLTGGSALAAPTNDNCGSALDVTAGTAQAFSIADATLDGTSATCSPGTIDMWFRYTPMVSQGATTITTTGTNFNGTMTAFESCGGAQITCTTSTTGFTLNNISSSHSYILRVARRSGTGTNCVLNITEFAAPANDTCNNATVAAASTLYSWNTLGAGTQLPGCSGSTQDVFFQFTAPEDASYDFSTRFSSFSPLLSLYDGCSGAELDCGSGAGGSARVSRFLSTGETVILRIAVPNVYGQALNGKLAITSDTTPAYDTCGGAISVSVGANIFNTSGCLTTDSSVCGGFRDAYFRFTAPQSARYKFDTTGSMFDAFYGFSSSCGSTETCGNVNSNTSYDLHAGQTIYLRVAGQGQGENRGYGVLNVTQTATYTDPINDLCANASVINTGDSVLIPSIMAATADGSAACASPAASPDVWFRYTPNFNGWIRVDTCASTLVDTVLSVYPSCGGAPIVCGNDGCGNGAEVIMPVSSGTTYRIRVGLGGFSPLGDATLRVTQITPPPTNEICATAITLVNDQQVTFDTTYATTETPGPSNWDFRKDIWYSFTVPASGQVSVGGAPTPGSTFNRMAIEVFDGCNGASILRATTSYPLTPKGQLCVAAGQQLKIRVGHVAFDEFVTGSPGAGALTLSYSPLVSYVNPPAGSISENEDCATRVANNTDIYNSGVQQFINNVWTFPAMPLACGTPVTGTMPQQGAVADRDWFAFDLVSPSTVLIIGSAEASGTVRVSNRVVPNDYSWDIAKPSACVKTFSATINLPNGDETYPSNYAVSIVPTNAAETGTCGQNESYWLEYFFVNNGSVSIGTQPTNKTAPLGGSATFTAAATGAGLKYQWRFGSTPLSNGGHYSGVDTASLTVSNVSAAEIGSYNLIAISGCGAAISNNATLSIGACAADFNGDSIRDVADLFGYINAWLAKTTNADFNHDSTVDVADLFGFINAWLAGC